MRIDLFLKTSRLIKRRKIAHEATVKELILINDKVAKPSTNVKLGDIVTLNLGRKQLIIKVTSLEIIKDDLMYQLIEEKFI